MIIRSTHTFGAGEAKTSIEAKWVAEHENPNRDIGTGGEAVDQPTDSVDRTRCTTAREARAKGSLGEYLEQAEDPDELTGFQSVEANPSRDQTY